MVEEAAHVADPQPGPAHYGFRADVSGGGDNRTQDEWVATWDEDRIALRGDHLVRVASAAWPRPTETTAEFVDLDLDFELDEPDLAKSSTRTRSRADNPVHGDLLPLIVHGLLVPGDRLIHTKVRSGETFHATVTSSGGLDTSAGHFRAPSTALSKAHRDLT